MTTLAYGHKRKASTQTENKDADVEREEMRPWGLGA